MSEVTCPQCDRVLRTVGVGYCEDCGIYADDGLDKEPANSLPTALQPGVGKSVKRPKDTRSEKMIQQAIRLRWELHGATVLNLSQPRATKQTPGLPDQIVLIPGNGCVFCEVKTPKGRQSEYQKEVEEACIGAGVHYLVARHEDDVTEFMEGL